MWNKTFDFQLQDGAGQPVLNKGGTYILGCEYNLDPGYLERLVYFVLATINDFENSKEAPYLMVYKNNRITGDVTKLFRVDKENPGYLNFIVSDNCNHDEASLFRTIIAQYKMRSDLNVNE
jgi:hypothetical protein